MISYFAVPVQTAVVVKLTNRTLHVHTNLRFSCKAYVAPPYKAPLCTHPLRFVAKNLSYKPEGFVRKAELCVAPCKAEVRMRTKLCFPVQTHALHTKLVQSDNP